MRPKATQCKKGHERTPENWDGRRCQACRKERFASPGVKQRNRETQRAWNMRTKKNENRSATRNKWCGAHIALYNKQPHVRKEKNLEWKKSESGLNSAKRYRATPEAKKRKKENRINMKSYIDEKLRIPKEFITDEMRAIKKAMILFERERYELNNFRPRNDNRGHRQNTDRKNNPRAVKCNSSKPQGVPHGLKNGSAIQTST